MTYTFHNRFTTFDDRIDIQAGTFQLADAEQERVMLLAGERDVMIADTGNLVLEGSGYVDEAAAVAAGRRWRKALTIAFARAHIGVDFGPDHPVTPRDDLVVKESSEILNRLGVAPGDRVIGDEHRLLVVTSEPRPRFVLITMHGTVLR
jgi:hypothetical protein